MKHQFGPIICVVGLMCVSMYKVGLQDKIILWQHTTKVKFLQNYTELDTNNFRSM